jgi:hypothetical protein
VGRLDNRLERALEGQGSHAVGEHELVNGQVRIGGQEGDGSMKILGGAAGERASLRR